MTAVMTERWTPVCALDALVADRGVCALVAGRAVAVFLLSGTGEVRAVDNHDPFAGASVLSRGLVGTAELDGVWVPYVASPLRRQRFSLRDGTCLDDADVQVGTYRVRVVGGVVEVECTSGRATTGSRWRDGAETAT